MAAAPAKTAAPKPPVVFPTWLLENYVEELVNAIHAAGSDVTRRKVLLRNVQARYTLPQINQPIGPENTTAATRLAVMNILRTVATPATPVLVGDKKPPAISVPPAVAVNLIPLD